MFFNFSKASVSSSVITTGCDPFIVGPISKVLRGACMKAATGINRRYIFSIPRNRLSSLTVVSCEFLNSLEFCVKRFDTCGGHSISQEIYLYLTKYALVRVD